MLFRGPDPPSPQQLSGDCDWVTPLSETVCGLRLAKAVYPVYMPSGTAVVLKAVDLNDHDLGSCMCKCRDTHAGARTRTGAACFTHLCVPGLWILRAAVLKKGGSSILQLRAEEPLGFK